MMPSTAMEVSPRGGGLDLIWKGSVLYCTIHLMAMPDTPGGRREQYYYFLCFQHVILDSFYLFVEIVRWWVVSGLVPSLQCGFTLAFDAE